jgi:hypothetical protein
MGQAFRSLCRQAEECSQTAETAVVGDLSSNSTLPLPEPPSSVAVSRFGKWWPRTVMAVSIVTVALVVASRGLPGQRELGSQPDAVRESQRLSEALTLEQAPRVEAPKGQPRVPVVDTANGVPRSSPPALDTASDGLESMSTDTGVIDAHLLTVGTVLMAKIESTLDSRRNIPGDPFVGLLEQALLRDGHEVIPAGARLEGRVEKVGLVDPGRPFVDLSLTSVSLNEQWVPIRTGFYRAIAPAVESTGPSFAAIVIGGLAGAAVGGAIGGGRVAAIGGVAGAAGASAIRRDVTGEYYLRGSLPFKIAETVYDKAAR